MENKIKILTWLQWSFITIQIILLVLYVTSVLPIVYTLSAGALSLVFGITGKELSKRLKNRKNGTNKKST